VAVLHVGNRFNRWRVLDVYAFVAVLVAADFVATGKTEMKEVRKGGQMKYRTQWLDLFLFRIFPQLQLIEANESVKTRNRWPLI
jgi:hypothetical protein